MKTGVPTNMQFTDEDVEIVSELFYVQSNRRSSSTSVDAWCTVGSPSATRAVP